MVALASVLACGVALGALRGGSLAGVSAARLAWVPLVFAALALQVGAEAVPGDAVALGMVIASYVALLAFAALNVRHAGMPLVAIGAALNFVVIVANGGMPISAEAAARAGYAGPAAEQLLLRGKHVLDAGGDVVLRPLSDVIPLWRAPAVASVGDLVIWAGLILLVAHLMTGGGRHARRARTAHPAET